MSSDPNFLSRGIERLTDSKKDLPPSEWAESRRYLSSGSSPQPGRWRSSVTPYVVEPLNHLSDQSPVREVVICKGAQVGMTVSLAENLIGWTIDESPCPMMYATSDEALAKSRMTLHIDRMIDDSGLRNKISSQTRNSKNKKSTGDTQLLKEFAGGFLIAASMGSANRGRSESIRRLILDEVDAAKDTLGKEGDPIKIFKARTAAYESTRKIYYISTPLIEQTSRIWELYLLGDQRRWFVPCIECGHMQFLDWKNFTYEVEKSGIGAEYPILDTVGYICEECKSIWRNDDKVFFLGRGEWRSTSTSKRPWLVSYHLSSFYSPIGFKSWETIVSEWVEAQNAKRSGDLRPLQVVVNTVFGEPWAERGDTPQYERVMLRRGDYNYVSGAPPDSGPLFLTAGIDIHEHHINTEKVAWGRDARSWSHSCRTIYGNIRERKIWSDLHEYLMEEEYTNSGRLLQLHVACIDSRYVQQAVFEFCAGRVNIFPVAGVSVPPGQRWGVPFKERPVQKYEGLISLDLDVHYLKDWVYHSLKLGLNPDGSSPEQFPHFPADYKEQFFRELTAEEKLKKRDRFGHYVYQYEVIGSRANHQLDCRVYALAGLYFYAYDMSRVSGVHGILWNDFWTTVEGLA